MGGGSKALGHRMAIDHQYLHKGLSGNTGTTIVTFLMVFLIQNTQNRDTTALHLKLDELIRVSESARNKLLDLEGLTEAELEHLKGSFTKLAGAAPDSAVLHQAA